MQKFQRLRPATSDTSDSGPKRVGHSRTGSNASTAATLRSCQSVLSRQASSSSGLSDGEGQDIQTLCEGCYPVTKPTWTDGVEYRQGSLEQPRVEQNGDVGPAGGVMMGTSLANGMCPIQPMAWQCGQMQAAVIIVPVNEYAPQIPVTADATVPTSEFCNFEDCSAFMAHESVQGPKELMSWGDTGNVAQMGGPTAAYAFVPVSSMGQCAVPMGTWPMCQMMYPVQSIQSKSGQW